MASILGDTKYYEPARRFMHHAVPIGDRLYLWGGRTEDFSESSKRKLASVVEIYDPYLEMWEQQVTTGVPPRGLYSGGCTSLDETLLWYGGYDGKSHCGSLHQLNTVTLNWDELRHNSPSQRPMAKYGCGLVSFQGNRLGLFGGYGIPTGPTQPGSTFIWDHSYSDGSGWTNEFHLFHLQEGVWSSPPTTGSRPPPCGGFSFTAIDSHRAVLFGGFSQELDYMNDVYIFNIQTMHWSKLDTSGGGPWPVGRSDHAACCLNYGEEHPQLLVSWGIDKHSNPLKDLWVLDVEAGTWKELMLPEGTRPRWAHTVTPLNLRSGVVEVNMFGGCPKGIPVDGDQQLPKIAETTVVRLESIEISASGGESLTKEWVVMGVAKGRQLGSLDRIREKMQEKASFLVSSELAGEREKVRKAESTITELEEKVESAETRVRVALARAVKAEKRCDRIPDLEQQLRSTQRLLHAKEEEFKALTTQYTSTHDHLLHSQKQFSTQQQALSQLNFNVQQKEEQLRAKIRENAALQAHNQALANQVVAFQTTVAQLEQRMQATQAALADTRKQIPRLEQQLHSKETQIQSLTEIHHHWQPPPTQPSVQTGTIGTRSPQAELHSQHAEIQQKVTEDTELLLPTNEEIQEKNKQLRSLQTDKQELQQQLEITSVQIQEQKERLTSLQAQQQKSEGQIKTLEAEKEKLQEELRKETFLEIAFGQEADVLREDLMDREEELHGFRTQQVQRHTASTDETVSDTHTPNTSPMSGFLRGVEVVAQRDLVISSKAQSYHWEEYGFRLHVPEGSLETGLSETTVNVRVSLSGYFQLPADSELVSAVYWVFSPHKFSQPLTVDIEHCAAPSQCSNLSFVRTKCTQKKLPYQFKELEGGVFSQQSNYGSISVSHFSGIGTAKKKSARRTTPLKKSESKSQDDSLMYCAQLYVQEGVKDRCVHFVVTRDLRACLTEVKKEFGDSGFAKCLSFLFEFEEQHSLRLDVPRDGTNFESGWRLSPLYDPTIKKSDVDHFSSGRRLPECELALRWLKDVPPAGFEHLIWLQGATEQKYFRLFIKEADISSGSESDVLYSPDSVKSGEITQQTACVSSPLPPIPTHKDLMNEVAVKIPMKWRFVGHELGLQPHQLDVIEKEQNGTLALCFSAVFQKWECATAPPYTWSTIITALEAPQVDERRLAQTLKGRLMNLK